MLDREMATFAEKYGTRYEKAVTCMTNGYEALLAFYNFPAEHSHDRSVGSARVVSFVERPEGSILDLTDNDLRIRQECLQVNVGGVANQHIDFDL